MTQSEYQDWINAQPCHAIDDTDELPAPADGVVQFSDGDGAIVIKSDGSMWRVEHPLPAKPVSAEDAPKLRQLLRDANSDSSWRNADDACRDIRRI